MTDPETNQGSPFWRFSLRLYRRPGVAEACIWLQDVNGVDVNVLLFLLWLATERRCVSPEVARAVCARTAPWRDDVVAPLRAVRRRLKEWTALVGSGEAEEFRIKVKAVELESERLQQEALFALAEELAMENVATIEAAARANVAAYEHVLGNMLNQAAVGSLYQALE